MTAICIVDRTGKIEREGVVASDPEAIAGFVRLHAPHVARIGLETGATSTWLWTELNKMELPVICIDARRAKAALKMQINKTDRNDAVGIARIMQCGWYKEVHVKGLDSHAIKALLVSRALLVKIVPPTVTACPSNSACDPGGAGTGAFCETIGADWMAPRSPAPMKYPRSNPSVISRAAPGMSNGLSPEAGPPCSVLLGRICSAPCCVISLMGVDECMAESRKLAAQARIADGIAPSCARRTMILGIA
jgi:hypothetical protein